MTIDELEKLLFQRARAGMKLGLERMQRALAQLGHPERCAPVLHVAGTNGKGSTCAFLESACRASGLRTGLYTSPHLQRFGERFRIDGTPASDEALLEAFAKLRRDVPWALAEVPDGLTFFELVTLLGFVALAEARPDVLVVEVGLGGRLDATNVVDPLVACLTPIDDDHREYLGDTPAEIALEKAGIIKAGRPVVSARQAGDVREVLVRVARERGADIEFEGEDFVLDGAETALEFASRDGRRDALALGLAGPHQAGNAAVAIRALEQARMHGLAITDAGIAKGLAAARWPGRFERLGAHPEVVLDGAHNPHGARALAEALRRLAPDKPLHLVIGLLADKDATPMLAALAPLAATIVTTTPSSTRALAAHELRQKLASMGFESEAIDSPRNAFAQARKRAGADERVVVCGSLYLVGEVRGELRGESFGGPSEQFEPTSTPSE